MSQHTGYGLRINGVPANWNVPLRAEYDAPGSSPLLPSFLERPCRLVAFDFNPVSSTLRLVFEHCGKSRMVAYAPPALKTFSFDAATATLLIGFSDGSSLKIPREQFATAPAHRADDEAIRTGLLEPPLAVADRMAERVQATLDEVMVRAGKDAAYDPGGWTTIGPRGEIRISTLPLAELTNSKTPAVRTFVPPAPPAPLDPVLPLSRFAAIKAANDARERKGLPRLKCACSLDQVMTAGCQCGGT